MEKILKKEAIGSAIMQMAELADSKGARLTVEIETGNGQMRIKAMVWGEDYSILGRSEFLSGDTALEARDAVSELERDMKSRGNM